MARERVRLPLVANIETDDSDPRTDAYAAILNGLVYQDSNKGIKVRKRPGVLYDTSAGSGNVYAVHVRETGSGFKVTSGRFENLAATTSLGVTFASSPSHIYTAGEFGEVVLVVVQDEGTYGKTYTVSSANTPTLRITGTPGSATEAIMHGAALMDGYGFVMGEWGDIYSSNVDDLTTWSATDFISMNYSDTGKFVCHYNNHIVGIGGRSIEFFYNSGSSSGSPLLPRKDIVHMANAVAYCSNNMDTVAWLDVGLNGEIGVYMLQNFNKTKISTFDIDKILQRMQTTNGFSSVRMSVMSYLGHHLIFVKLLDESGNSISRVFDVEANLWYEWTWGTSTTALFPYSVANAETAGDYYVALGNGYVFTFSSTKYVDDTNNTDSSNINFSITTPLFRGLSNDSGAIKRASDLQIDGARNSNVTLSIRYSDDQAATWSTARSLSLAKAGTKLTQLGSFYERYWQLYSTDNYPIELTQVSMVIDEGMM